MEMTFYCYVFLERSKKRPKDRYPFAILIIWGISCASNRMIRTHTQYPNFLDHILLKDIYHSVSVGKLVPLIPIYPE